jgi:glycosyltransferase involved in cell wall biosynthesis
MVQHRATSEAAFVVAALALPPPLHGQSLVNAEIARRLEIMGGASIRIFDISPGCATRGLTYHITRIHRVFYVGLKLLTAARGRSKSFYTVFEAGTGIVYNFVLIGLARLLGYRIVLHHHSSQHSLAKRKGFLLLTRFGGDLTHVALSDGMAADLAKRYPLVRRLLVCNNACHVPHRDLPRRQRMVGRPLTVGLLANLNREKGLDVVLETIQEGRQQGLDLELVLAGPLVGADAQAAIAEAKKLLGPALRTLGPIAGAEKSAFFQAIDVFFFPTSYPYEAQPLVILEAMSHAIPVIATDRGYIREMLGGRGVVLPADQSVVSLALLALRHFLHSPDALVEQGDDAREQFLRMYRRSIVEQQRVIETILGVT